MARKLLWLFSVDALHHVPLRRTAESNQEKKEILPANILFAFADDWVGMRAPNRTWHTCLRCTKSAARLPTPESRTSERPSAMRSFQSPPCALSQLDSLGAVLLADSPCGHPAGAVWVDEIPTFPRVLAAGYRTRTTYKALGQACLAKRLLGGESHYLNQAGGRFS